MKGYYSWNWGSGSTGPSGTSSSDDVIGVAFTGLVSVQDAIKGYDAGATWCCPELRGSRFLSLGGGNAAGSFTASALTKIKSSMGAIKAANYSGIILDVEEATGSAKELVPAFAAVLAAAKGEGLRTAVTTSHSAPYQCDSANDAVALVKAWVADPNLDILSPQLYSSGQEGSPQFDTTASCSPACSWSLYKGFKGIFAPSIVEPSHYPATKAFFAATNVDTGGFFEWKQEA